jgi:gas vesicle protein GvpA/GvpJ/GvpM family
VSEPGRQARGLEQREAEVASYPQRNVALVDLLDRLLGGGVVLGGEITLSLADVDLVHLTLRLLITPVSGEPTP